MNEATHATHSERPEARLILASASSARADVLQRGHIPFTTMVSDVDEDALGAGLDHPTPAELAGALARAKAEDVTATLLTEDYADDGADDEAEEPPPEDEPALLVLGCDSVFELDGNAYGKPEHPEVAIERWRIQAGRTGTLHTGHRLIRLPDTPGALPEDAVSATVSTQVRFADVSEQQIQHYVATGEPLGCAGGFTLEGRGAALVAGVSGDPNAVLGLSLNTLREMFDQVGCSLTQMWTP